MTKDPVCMTDVDEAEALAMDMTMEENGRRFYFCSPECKERFERDPGAFMWPSEPTEPLDSEGAQTSP